MRAAILPLILCSLAACKAQTDPGQPAPAVAAPSSESTPAQPAAPVVSPRTELPTPGAIGFSGYGQARFGASAETVRAAWGKGMDAAQPDAPGGCYYLMPPAAGDLGNAIGFMVEGDKFVRIDVNSSQIEAPGGGKVGMDEAGLRKHYGAALQSMPHKYVEGGHYLWTRQEGAPAKLLFETNEHGKVTTWRIGVPPQVDYVEGCG